MNLQDLKTKSGKTAQDFKIPDVLLKNDPELVALILGSESMNDPERQYWFNLTAMMTPDQIEKLRDILTREKTKLAEIEAKYSKKKEPVDSVVAQKRAKEQAERRKQQQEEIRARETEHKESEDHEDILEELDGME